MADTFNFAINFYPQIGASTIVCHSTDGIDINLAHSVAMDALARATSMVLPTPRIIVDAVARELREQLSCDTVIVRADVTANVRGYSVPFPTIDHKEDDF